MLKGREFYRVIDSNSYYDGMLGLLVIEFPDAVMLEIEMKVRGFTSPYRVIFYDRQIRRVENV